MALVKRITVDGEDVDIEDLTNTGLSHAILATESDIVALSLYEGELRGTFSGTEHYRKTRLGFAKRKLKSLSLEARRRKLEID